MPEVILISIAQRAKFKILHKDKASDIDCDIELSGTQITVESVTLNQCIFHVLP